ncbi:MAG: ferritin-like domain-containing protein [Myxococcales bacterium]|nr:ferritin-like domain-containing protein [Myxococcales bacterium]MCB9630025.1 ferritin-like domain-containing protein [Sandaracinaceae bacterium]
MKLDLTQMLQKIEAGYWSLDDIDWDQPGHDLIKPEQYGKLRDFMCDLVWIEHVGAKGFAALARQAPDPLLAEIYRHFEREEAQHARAELALMRRWGMVGAEEIPVANVNIRLTMQWMDKHTDTLDFATLTCVIAMLEVALDGALVKLLLDQVEDPVCHEVFRLINRDEARHLTMDFHVMELMGLQPQTINSLRFAAKSLRPERIVGALTYVPLLSRMRNNLVKMGLDEERLYKSIRRFDEVGSRSAATERLSAYRAVRAHGRMVVDPKHPYHYFADALVRLTAAIPERALGPLPTWTRTLAQPTPGARPLRSRAAAA